MAFHDAAVLPVEYAFGSSGGPAHETVIQQTRGGRSVYLPTLDEPVMRYEIDISMLDPQHQKFARLVDFVRARRGAAHGFRLLDFTDYATNADHVLEVDPDDVTARHQIGVGDGSTTLFRLSKTYSDSGESVVRRIEKPMRVSEANAFESQTLPFLAAATQTVWVWIDSVLKTEGADYTVNYGTGTITFGSAPTAGQVVEWAGYFFVPVHFGPEADKFMRLTASSWAQRQTDTLTMVEEKADTAFLGLDRSPRGAVWVTLEDSQHQLELHEARDHYLDADGLMSAPFVLLPEPGTWMLGTDLLFVANVGASIGLDIRDHNGSALPSALTIAAGNAARFHLAPDGSGGFDWVVS